MPTEPHVDTLTSEPSDIPTHFAPAGRKGHSELTTDIGRVTINPLVNSLMTIANGLFAVLNDKRQVITVNDAFIKMIGIEDSSQILGLRPGECVHCVHACEMPGGCGTTEYCSTCGAVVSIMAAMESRQPQERTCALTIEKDNQQVDLYFNVRSCPVFIDDEMFILMFMQDVSVQQHRNCLDRTFFHDINNILCALVGKSEMLTRQENPDDVKIRELHQVVQRIVQEISIQNSLQKSLDISYKPLYADISANSVIKEIEQMFHDHPLLHSRTLTVSYAPHDIMITTDFHLVSRIVMNMVTNALDATPEGDTVTLSLVPQQNAVSFRVWNPGEIPQHIAKRIFQRNFSTKGALGRGFGTYSMKLFGEQVLGGAVAFETSLATGTVFTFTLITQ